MYKPSCVNPVSCGKINEYEAGEMSTPSRQNGRNSGNPRPGAVKIKKGAVSLAQINLETLDRILKAHDYDPTLVIGIMQDIQKEYHYLPPGRPDLYREKAWDQRSENLWSRYLL